MALAVDNDTLIEQFSVQHFDRNGISAGRRAATLVALRTLAGRLDGRTLAELTPSDLMEWQGAELKRGLSPNSLRNRESMVQAFIKWAYLAEFITFERKAQLKSVGGQRSVLAHLPPRPYRRRELERFREELDARYPLAPTTGIGSHSLKRFFRGTGQFNRHVRLHARRLQLEAQVSLALEEGLRLTEIFNITLPQVHYDNAAVVVITAKSKAGQRREREIPWSEHSRQCVYEWLEFRRLLVPTNQRPWLMLSYPRVAPYDRPLRFQQLRQAFRSWPTRWSWHRFRHTFATERLRSGVPLEQLQIMLGHAQLQQTLGYAQIVNADIQRETDRTGREFERLIGVAA